MQMRHSRLVLAIGLLGCIFLLQGVCLGRESVESETENPPAEQKTADEAKAEKPQSLKDWLEEDEDVENGPPGEKFSLIRQLITSLVFVGILGAGVWFVSKKISPKMIQAKGGELELVESLSLGGQKGIHLISIRGRESLVVASTKEGLSLLCEIAPGGEGNEIADADTGNPL